MKSFKILVVLAAFFAIGLTSCTKEDVDKETTTELPTDVESGVSNPLVDNLNSRSDEGCELACFTINYPFELSIDSVIVEVNADTDIQALLEDAIFVDFVYPFDITYEDGTTAVINSGEELGEAFATCVPDEGWEPTDSTEVWPDDAFPAYLISTDDGCFDLVYPVTLSDLDGESYTANDEGEFIDLLADTEDWNFLFFDYPITLVDEDGVESTANNGGELFELLVSCDEFGGGGYGDSTFTFGGELGGCYDLVYPFSVTLVDGTTQEVNDHNEYCALMIEGNITGFVYPITIVDLQGDEVVVNNDEELDELLEDCWDFGGGPELDPSLLFLISSSNAASEFGCFDIVWPISIDVDSVEISISSIDEVNTYLVDGIFPILIYPVTITPNSTGEDTVLNDFEDLIAILEDCE